MTKPIPDWRVVRGLPKNVGVFSLLREEGGIYADKTDLVYKMTHSLSRYVYLSRPRRFGKSLLVSLLESYFQADRRLFEGLRMAELEQEWEARPVLHFTLNEYLGTASDFASALSSDLDRHEQRLQLSPEAPLNVRLKNIIQTYAQRGPQPVVLIDEYDAPLQNAWKNKPLFNELIAQYREIFTVLKGQEANLRFTFLTGCTRFKNQGLLSLLNNLLDISFEAEYATLCGLTRQEIETCYDRELDKVSKLKGWTPERTLKEFTDYYDGYLFSLDRPVERVFNPSSVAYAMAEGKFAAYWLQSGGSVNALNFGGVLPDDPRDIEHETVSQELLETGDFYSCNPALVLYQSGYLTLDRCSDEGNYQLRIPNQEVRQALYRGLLPMLSDIEERTLLTQVQEFGNLMRSGKMDEALWQARLYVASVKFDGTKLEALQNEQRCQYLMMALCQGAGLPTQIELGQARGVPDLVAHGPQDCFVVEFKRTCKGGLAKGWRQVCRRGYVEPHLSPRWRRVYALCLEVADDGKALLNWRGKVYQQQDGQLLVKQLTAQPRWLPNP